MKSSCSTVADDVVKELRPRLRQLAEMHHEAVVSLLISHLDAQRGLSAHNFPSFFAPEKRKMSKTDHAELEESVPVEHEPYFEGYSLSAAQIQPISLAFPTTDPITLKDAILTTADQRLCIGVGCSSLGGSMDSSLTSIRETHAFASVLDMPTIEQPLQDECVSYRGGSFVISNTAENSVASPPPGRATMDSNTSPTSPEGGEVEECGEKSRVTGNSSGRPVGKYATLRKKRDEEAPIIRAGLAASLAPYVLSQYFDYSVAVVVVVNTVMLGWQIHHEALGGGYEVGFTVVEQVCSFIFLMELVLRVLVLGKGFCSPAERSWGVFDLFLVTLSIVDLVMALIQGSFGNDTETVPGAGQSGKLLKVVRTARVMRILRMVRFLGELRVMVRMIINSTLSLLWLMLLLVILVYVFAILLTQGATDYLREFDDSHNIREFYGSLWATMYTLFKAMTDGQSWHVAADALGEVGTFYFALFLGYIFFTLFSVLNIVTGVFVDGAIQLANSDRALLIKKDIMSREATAQQLMELLEEIDFDNDGFITLSEFESSFVDDRVNQFLAALQVDGCEASELFNLLDEDGSGEIDIDEFVEGMQRLRGEAKSLDMHMLRRTCKTIKTMLFDHINIIEGQVPLIIEALANADAASSRGSKALLEKALQISKSRGTLPLGSPIKKKRDGRSSKGKGFSSPHLSFEHLTLSRSQTAFSGLT